MKHKCICPVCNRSKRVRSCLSKVGNELIRTELESLFYEYDTENEVLSNDLARLESIMEGTWPDSEGFMEDSGWFRKDHIEQHHKVGKLYDIKSFDIRGNLMYGGLAHLVRVDGGSMEFNCFDGKVREVCIGSQVYPKDSAVPQEEK